MNFSYPNAQIGIYKDFETDKCDEKEILCKTANEALPFIWILIFMSIYHLGNCPHKFNVRVEKVWNRKTICRLIM